MPQQPSFQINNVSVRTSRSGLNEGEQYVEEEVVSSDPPVDIATRFKENYKTKGLQPSVGQRPTISYKNTSSLPTQTNLSGVQKRKKWVPAVNGGGVISGNAAPLSRNRLSKKQLFANIDPTGTSSNLAAIATVSRVNWFILTWAIPLWLFVQIPLALLALAGLGFAAGSEAALEALFGGIVGSFIETVAATASSAVSYIFGTNIDLNPLNAIRDLGLGIVIVLHVCAYFVGIITLSIMAFMYVFSGINCFFGHWSAAKIGFFIFALAGYFFPIANLVPWFILWGIVVWLSQIKATT